jgi:hypothetical protein
LTINTWWRHSVAAPDQLRQRGRFCIERDHGRFRGGSPRR